MIDLRSDTVTLPTEEMREAMRRAELGDDSREGDPTVRRLEEAAAAKLGKEAALFVASGTMSNLVALLAHTGRGGEVLLDGNSHIMRSEMGGIAALAGLFYRTIPSARGAPDLAEIGERLSEKLGANKLATALVCVETTHNSAGGAVIPLDYMARLRALTNEKNVPVHIDGARIFNAAVALGVPAAQIARHGDSIGFCVSNIPLKQADLGGAKEIIVGIRPEHFEDAAVDPEDHADRMKFRTKIDVVESMGCELYVYFDVKSEELHVAELQELAADAGMEDLPSHGDGQQVVARLAAESKAPARRRGRAGRRHQPDQAVRRRHRQEPRRRMSTYGVSVSVGR